MRTKIYFIILLLLVVNRISAQNIDNNKFPNHWIDCVINVIGSYETSTSDWGTITPNFDGQGISCGLIQLNIGQSSFQPFFLSFDQNTLERYMPIYGKKMFEICKLSKKDALIEIDRFQRNTINSKGKTIVKFNDKGEILAKELSTLLQSNEGIHKQKELMIKKANKVWNYTKEWATDIRGKKLSTYINRVLSIL
ncbi:Uncharacterised protein [Sphingobacterium spiritivorum]|uniref:Uncharacterized protein n=1 Tax=Sphingobacterium spiritivorum TaxID=258 RepID=A0A380CSJ9_SPHSI|nr:hypothetical protein [Sphingobacterium spiritivorum]SUJ26794.1 Uncharacterised protein [Sphingobacterium spiritivorum]